MTTNISNTTPWQIDEKDYPKDGSLHERLQFILNYAILASSLYDSQPWQFAIDENKAEINIYADRSRWLQLEDPDKNELYMSLGCALENLLIAIDYFGMGHRSVAYLPEPTNKEWVVRIQLGVVSESVVPRPHWLFPAIDHNQSHVSAFKERPLSREDLSEILGFVDDHIYEETTMTHRIALDNFDEQRKQALLNMVSENDVALFSNASFRQELSGMLAEGKVNNPAFTEEFNTLETDPDVGNIIANKESTIVSKAPYIGVLSSNYDDPTAAVKIGQTFERIGLQATLRGVGVYPVFQLLGTQEMKVRMENMLPEIEGYPHLVFAMGYVERQVELNMTPRIPLDQLLRTA